MSRYVKNKVSVKEGVAELVKTQEGNKEILTTTDKEKAQVLANFFGSVFTKEPDNSTIVQTKELQEET